MEVRVTGHIKRDMEGVVDATGMWKVFGNWTKKGDVDEPSDHSNI